VSLLIQTQRWRERKPFGPQEIDRAHPLARDLVGYFLVNELDGPVHDLAGTAVSPMALEAGATWQTDPDRDIGVGGGSAKVTTVNSWPEQPLVLPPCTTVSDYRVIAKQSSGTRYASRLWTSFPGGTSIDLRFTPFVFQYNITDNFTGQTVSGPTSFPPANGERYLHVGRSNSHTSHELIVNGTSLATGTTDTSAKSFNRFDTVEVKGDANVCVFWHALWNRALSDDELVWLNAEPYALLRPRRRRLFYVVAGGAVSGVASLSGTGIITAVARKGALIGAAITARPGLAILASKGARAAGVLGAAGTLSVIARAARKSALTITGAGATAITGTSARRVTALVSAGGALAVFGSPSSTPVLEGRILLSGLFAPTQALAGTSKLQVVLQGSALHCIPLDASLP